LTGSRLGACIAVAAFCAAAIVLGGAASSAPLGKALGGLPCQFGPYEYWALGNPLMGPDKPGKTGNEIKQIYRVFYSRSPDSPAVRRSFGGWLLATFDKRFAYAPPALPRQRDQFHLASVEVPPPNDPRHLPLTKWVRQVAAFTKTEILPQELAGLEGSPQTSTALSQCFSSDWDGISRRK